MGVAGWFSVFLTPPPTIQTRQVIKLKNIPPKEQEACKNEVELLSRMCHPNIVGYTNSFLYKNCLCIIMEYCDAGDLGDRVNEAKVCTFFGGELKRTGYLPEAFRPLHVRSLEGTCSVACAEVSRNGRFQSHEFSPFQVCLYSSADLTAAGHIISSVATLHFLYFRPMRRRRPSSF